MRNLVRLTPGPTELDSLDYNLANLCPPVGSDAPPQESDIPRDFHGEGKGDLRTWLILLGISILGLGIALAAMALPAGLHAAMPTIQLY